MLRIYYPTGTLTGATDLVTLRSPEFGDVQRVNNEAIVLESRGGDLMSVKDTDWPDSQTNVYQFTRIQESVIDELKAFLIKTAGLQIDLIDHLDQLWRGVIVTPINEIIEVRETCSYDVSFEFMGDKVP